MIVLNDFLGDKFKYDEPSQSISFELTDNQRAAAMASNTRTRPRWRSAWGSVVNYTLFRSETSGLSPRQTTPHMLHDATQDVVRRGDDPLRPLPGFGVHLAVGKFRRHQHVAGAGSGLAQRLPCRAPSTGTCSDTVVLTISY
jgi:hypothetical protein